MFVAKRMPGRHPYTNTSDAIARIRTRAFETIPGGNSVTHTENGDGVHMGHSGA